MRTGHNAKQANGTVTFLKYKNAIFACTCRHVLNEVKGNLVLAVMADRMVLNFASIGPDGILSSFRRVQDSTVDIAISPVPAGMWLLLAKKKAKQAIDLDTFNPPPWDLIKFCHAAGYPCEHKVDSGTVVRSPMPRVVAELRTTVSKGTKEFTLHSSLNEPHGFFFSGMSGGPIVGETDKGDLVPVGIVFEGAPSSKKRQRSIFAGPNDLMIRGYVLTPEVFDYWLQHLEPFSKARKMRKLRRSRPTA
jgi:hypothetical protein